MKTAEDLLDSLAKSEMTESKVSYVEAVGRVAAKLPDVYTRYARDARHGESIPAPNEQATVAKAGPVERRIEAAVDLMLKEHPEWTREACYGRVLANRELYNAWRQEQMLAMAGGGDAA